MSYCGKCGVEVDNGVVACPLCGFALPVWDDQAVPDPAYPAMRLPAEQAPGRKRRVTWLVLSYCILASFLMALAADLVQHEEITWSRYALSTLGLVWLLATWILLLFRFTWLVYPLWFASTVGFLALVDVFRQGLFWFLPLGLPITGMVFGTAVLLHLLYRKAGMRGALIVAMFFVLMIPFCFGLELLVTGFTGGLRLGWSYIVLSIAGPVAVFLFYYHVKLSPQIDLKRLFHV